MGWTTNSKHPVVFLLLSALFISVFSIWRMEINRFFFFFSETKTFIQTMSVYTGVFLEYTPNLCVNDHKHTDLEKILVLDLWINRLQKSYLLGLKKTSRKTWVFKHEFAKFCIWLVPWKKQGSCSRHSKASGDVSSWFGPIYGFWGQWLLWLDMTSLNSGLSENNGW